MCLGPSRLAFEVFERAQIGCTVLDVRGEIDLESADRLWAHVERAIVSGQGDVVVDLSPVTFFDSAGLAVLIKAHRRLNGTRRRVIVRRPSDNVRRVLDISGLSDLIMIED